MAAKKFVSNLPLGNEPNANSARPWTIIHNTPFTLFMYVNIFESLGLHPLLWSETWMISTFSTNENAMVMGLQSRVRRGPYYKDIMCNDIIPPDHEPLYIIFRLKIHVHFFFVCDNIFESLGLHLLMWSALGGSRPFQPMVTWAFSHMCDVALSTRHFGQRHWTREYGIRVVLQEALQEALRGIT